MDLVIKDWFVVDGSGSFDQKASYKKALAELKRQVMDVARQSTGSKVHAVEAEVDGLFDSMGTDMLKCRTIATRICANRGLDLDNDYSSVEREVRAFIADSPRFKAAKGRYGGITRLNKVSTPPVSGVVETVSDELETSDEDLEAEFAAETADVDVDVHAESDTVSEELETDSVENAAE